MVTEQLADGVSQVLFDACDVLTTSGCYSTKEEQEGQGMSESVKCGRDVGTGQSVPLNPKFKRSFFSIYLSITSLSQSSFPPTILRSRYIVQ